MKKILVIICAAALYLALDVPASAQDKSKVIKNAEAVFVDAVQDYENGNYKQAKTRLSVITEADPSNDAAFYYLGLCDYYLGNEEDAVKDLCEAVRLDPDNYWYRERLAVLYSMTGREDLTVEMYEDLLEDYPKKSDLYYNLVNLYARQNRMDKVMESLDHIEAFRGKDETTTLARYDVLMHQNKPEEAFKVLEDFNEDFSSPQILCMMGDAMLSEYKDTLALAYYDEALALDSESVPAIIGKSEVFRMRHAYGDYFSTLNDFTTSSSVPVQMKSQYLSNLTQHLDPRFVQTYKPQIDTLFETGVRMHPADSSMLLTAGTYYFRSDRHDRAIELFKANSELYPEDFNSVAMYIQALSFDEKWEALAEESDKAFRTFPDEPAFLNMVLMAHFNMKDYHAVIEDSGRMIASFPKDTAAVVQAYSSIGDCYHLLNDEKSAFKAYEKALKVDPEYAPVLNNYAYYLSLKKKKLAKAYKMSKITIEQEPDNATYLDTFAWILHLQGKSLEAKSMLKHAMLYGGKDSAAILDHYAEVLFALGEYDLAGVYWNMAKQKNTDNEIPDLDKRIEEKMNSVKK